MRSLSMPALVALFALSWMIGCSSEESSPPPRKPEVVRKSITTPSKTDPAVSEAVSDKTQKSEKAPDVRSERTEVPSGVTAVEKGTGPGDKSGVTESREDLASGQTSETSETIPRREETPSESQTGPVAGEYTAQPGDSLAVAAGREDVLGDPLKWPVLFQLNREKLAGMTLDERLPERPVPDGVHLRYTLTPEEREQAETGPEANWVVNVVSSPTADRIDGAAVRLLKKGYSAYISRATIEGQKWMRLRVGFFQDRDSAVKAGKELQAVLGQEDSWPVRIGPEEKAEYAYYLKPLQGER